jgi:hypothetical protein
VLLVVSKSKRKDSDIVGELHPFEVKWSDVVLWWNM